MKINKNNLLIKKYKEYIIVAKYIIIGISTGIVGLTTYTVLTNIFGINLSLANAIEWIVAVNYSFFTNKLLVFESKSFKLDTIFREYTIFISGRITTGLMSIVAFPIFILIGFDQEIFGIKGLAAKLIVGISISVINFVVSRFLVFKKEME